jgi:hypothetical protein
MIGKFAAITLLLAGLAACTADEKVSACKDGHLAADFLASPVDGGGAILSDGKPVPVSAGYQGHKRIAEAARSSRFKFFHVPLRIEARCKYVEYDGKRFIELSEIETLLPVSDTGTFNRLYAEFGIEPVAIGPESQLSAPR